MSERPISVVGALTRGLHRFEVVDHLRRLTQAQIVQSDADDVSGLGVGVHSDSLTDRKDGAALGGGHHAGIGIAAVPTIVRI